MSDDTLAERDASGDPERDAAPGDEVTALRSCPDRTVFTENGNADGWISTDVTIQVER